MFRILFCLALIVACVAVVPSAQACGGVGVNFAPSFAFAAVDPCSCGVQPAFVQPSLGYSTFQPAFFSPSVAVFSDVGFHRRRANVQVNVAAPGAHVHVRRGLLGGEVIRVN